MAKSNHLTRPSFYAVATSEQAVSFQVTNSVPSDNYVFICQVKDSSNVEKTGLKSWYDSTTGILSVAGNGSTTELAAGDQIFVTGFFHK